MDSALIISNADKGTAFFSEQLNTAAINRISVLSSCSEARRSLLEHDYDLVIINAPLKDETGEALARSIASKGLAQVILLVKNEFFDEISAICEEDGVLVVSRPINRAIFWSALQFAKSARNRIRRVQTENERLKQKIEDIRIVDRAKCLLISHMKLSEQEAHRVIEKQAMDMRSTKRAIAEEILKTYEN